MRSTLEDNLAYNQRLFGPKFAATQQLLTGAYRIPSTDSTAFFLDPNGVTQIVFLPVVVPQGGQYYIIANTGVAGNLEVRTATGLAVATIPSNRVLKVISSPSGGWATDISAAGPSGPAGVPEAPLDGTIYSRSMASWVPTPGSGPSGTTPPMLDSDTVAEQLAFRDRIKAFVSGVLALSTSPQTLTAADNSKLVTNQNTVRTVNLPTPSVGLLFAFQTWGAALTVQAPSGFILPVGAAVSSTTIPTYGYLMLACDGTNWNVIADSYIATRRKLIGNTTFYIRSTAVSITISNASPAVVTWTGHGLLVNQAVVLSALSGAVMPTGLVKGTTYFIKTVLDANTFTVSATVGGAAINTSSASVGSLSASAGNDAGDGSAPTPTQAFMTRAAARAYVQNKVDLAGFTVNFQCANGNYSEALVMNNDLTGQLSAQNEFWIGNPTTPSLCELSITEAVMHSSSVDMTSRARAYLYPVSRLVIRSAAASHVLMGSSGFGPESSLGPVRLIRWSVPRTVFWGSVTITR
jgi:hypothetical protein